MKKYGNNRKRRYLSGFLVLLLALLIQFNFEARPQAGSFPVQAAHLASVGHSDQVYHSQKITKATLSNATLSNAAQVDWNVYFVEKGNHSQLIFRTQVGSSLEDTELSVDFPEKIVGKDGYFYAAAESSPCLIPLSGQGTQKFYIEFIKGERVPEKENPDSVATEKLRHWMETARASDHQITGRDSSDAQLISADPKESNARMINLVSMAAGRERQELYIIARGFVPNALVIGQTFREVKNVSELTMDQFSIEKELYTVMRVAFEKTYSMESCTHHVQVTDQVKAQCLLNGHEVLICKLCGYEVNTILPAKGHLDGDGDNSCDICYQSVGSGEPERVHFNEGDIQARRVGTRIYLFRCIDEDYEDGMDNSRATALFLCDQMIRADIDSTLEQQKTFCFGSSNNYKASEIRTWLNNNATDDLFATHTSYTGITTAYTGATKKGSCEQLEERDLIGHEKPFQLMQDKIFVLSVEEALKYRTYLWRFQGSDENNAETQHSAYSKGYWLRTPQYGGTDGFTYGSGAYIVDTVDGNIRITDVNDRSIGLRPAMTITQN